MDLSPNQIKHMVATMAPEEIKTWIQNEGLQAWRKANYRGTLEMATGTGKTRIALLAAHAEFQSDPNAVVVIATVTVTMRDDDWPKEMRLCGLDYLIEKTTRVCWISLPKLKMKRDVSLFVGDEMHHLTERHVPFFRSENYKVFRVMGLTATLPDGDPDAYQRELEKRMMIDAFAPSVFQVPLEQAIELKLVADFEVTVLLVDLDNTRNDVKVSTREKIYWTTELKRYAELTRNLQKATIAANADKKKEGWKFACINQRVQFLSNLKQKIILAKEVMAHILKDKERTLIFCGSIAQSVELCGKQVYNSQTNSEYLELFQECKIDYLGVCDALNEGKNINMLDQMLAVQLDSHERNIIQRIGRTVRWRENHKAKVIVLVAKGTVDENWYKSSFASFNRKRIKEYHVKPS